MKTKRAVDMEGPRVTMRVFSPRGYTRVNAGKRLDSWSYEITDGTTTVREDGFYTEHDANRAGRLALINRMEATL